MPLELFVLPDQGGLYPRRVLIYLAEKKLLKSPSIRIKPISMLSQSAPGKPPGTVPILSLGNNTSINQSIPIIEFLEDLCDAAQSFFVETLLIPKESGGHVMKDAFEGASPSMRGSSLEQRGRIRDIIGLADEATTHFAVACHKGSALFSLTETQNVTAAQFALASCRKTLGLIEEYYKEDERFQEFHFIEELDCVNIADCVLFTLLQFSLELYGRNLTEGFPHLGRFYELFAKRDSAQVKEGTFPKELKTLASHCTCDPKSGSLKVFSLYISVLWDVLMRGMIKIAGMVY